MAAMLLACGTPAPVVAPPTSLFATDPGSLNGTAPAASGPASPAAPQEATSLPIASRDFGVAVIVDTTTQQVSREQAQAAINQAGKFLREFSPIGLSMLDFTSAGNGGTTADMAARYVGAHPGLPDGLLIFSNGDNAQARTSGGYGFTLPGPPGFKNRFISPVAGADVLYVAVVDYAYRYMACGYGTGNDLQSAVSLPGECRGQTGLACISQNGYSMCPNAVGNLYASSPSYAVSSMIVHGLLHNFGPAGDRDHYATPECNARMGYPPSFFDLQESEYYNGLCPFVYEQFTNSFHP